MSLYNIQQVEATELDLRIGFSHPDTGVLGEFLTDLHNAYHKLRECTNPSFPGSPATIYRDYLRVIDLETKNGIFRIKVQEGWRPLTPWGEPNVPQVQQGFLAVMVLYWLTSGVAIQHIADFESLHPQLVELQEKLRHMQANLMAGRRKLYNRDVFTAPYQSAVQSVISNLVHQKDATYIEINGVVVMEKK